MSRAEELPDRLTDVEAGDIIEYMNKEYFVKGVTLDDKDDEWRIVTEDGSVPESDVTLINKRERDYE